MMVVRQFCHGYANGCACTHCDARSEGIDSGLLFYDRSGRLRYQGREQAIDSQALVAYMRDRQRKTPVQRAA